MVGWSDPVSEATAAGGRVVAVWTRSLPNVMRAASMTVLHDGPETTQLDRYLYTVVRIGPLALANYSLHRASGDFLKTYIQTGVLDPRAKLPTVPPTADNLAEMLRLAELGASNRYTVDNW